MPVMQPDDVRKYGKVCPRCRKKCPGRFMLLTCTAEYDGKTAMDEAEELLSARYVVLETPVADEVRPQMMRCFYGDDILVPWDPDKDRRPRTKRGPRVGMTFPFEYGPGSAVHGECTFCVNEAHDERGVATVSAATWRRTNPSGTTVASLCDRHARKVASPPIEVPEFADAEAALAWLDRITEERTA